MKPKECPFLCWIPLFIVLPIGVIGWLNQSYFEVGTAFCGMLFFFLQRWLIHFGKKEESVQRKNLKATGFLALLPALGMLAAGVRTIAVPHSGLPLKTAYGVVALSALLVLLYSFQLFTRGRKQSQANRFLRFVAVAGFSMPAALIVALSLKITQSEGGAALASMTTIVFAAVAVVIALNLILVSFMGYQSTVNSIRVIGNLVKSKKLVFTRISIAKDAVLVVGKGLISIISLSFFMFVNTVYSAGMGIARFIALRMHTQDRKTQEKSYRLVGIIIACASLCYVLYSVRLFFGGKSADYSMNIALVIALYTFVEFGINIREALRLRKSNRLAAKALRAISFASTLLCFVLTQTAIMSFASKGDNSSANAFSGVVFGGLAALIGIYIILDSFYQKKQHK